MLIYIHIGIQHSVHLLAVIDSFIKMCFRAGVT